MVTSPSIKPLSSKSVSRTVWPASVLSITIALKVAIALLLLVMAGHSRSKNGVASLAYVPAIHVFIVLSCGVCKTWMPGTRVYTWARQRRDPSAGHDGLDQAAAAARRGTGFSTIGRLMTP